MSEELDGVVENETAPDEQDQSKVTQDSYKKDIEEKKWLKPRLDRAERVGSDKYKKSIGAEGMDDDEVRNVFSEYIRLKEERVKREEEDRKNEEERLRKEGQFITLENQFKEKIAKLTKERDDIKRAEEEARRQGEERLSAYKIDRRLEVLLNANHAHGEAVAKGHTLSALKAWCAQQGYVMTVDVGNDLKVVDGNGNDVFKDTEKLTDEGMVKAFLDESPWFMAASKVKGSGAVPSALGKPVDIKQQIQDVSEKSRNPSHRIEQFKEIGRNMTQTKH